MWELVFSVLKDFEVKELKRDTEQTENFPFVPCLSSGPLKGLI